MKKDLWVVVRKYVLFLAIGLLLLLAVWVMLAPADTRLGNVVKLVYVHGALVWSGLFAFTLAGVLGAVALVVRYVFGAPARAAAWYRGTRAGGQAALMVWLIYALSAVLVTGLTWGVWLAWGEPRVRVTAMILAAAVALAVVVHLVDQRDLTAVANVAMGIAPWVAVSQVETIRHPVNPIGGSGSASMQGFYLLIVLTVAALAMALAAWLWAGKELGIREDFEEKG